MSDQYIYFSLRCLFLENLFLAFFLAVALFFFPLLRPLFYSSSSCVCSLLLLICLLPSLLLLPHFLSCGSLSSCFHRKMMKAKSLLLLLPGREGSRSILRIQRYWSFSPSSSASCCLSLVTSERMSLHLIFLRSLSLSAVLVLALPSFFFWFLSCFFSEVWTQVFSISLRLRYLPLSEVLLLLFHLLLLLSLFLLMRSLTSMSLLT